MDVIEFPREWYRFASIVFRLRSSSQVSSRPWAGGNTIYGPHAQLWMPRLTGALIEGDEWQKHAALFDWLGGQAGLLRMSDPLRTKPLYNRRLIAEKTKFTDNTGFTDGTGFLDGLLPPTAIVMEAVERGSKNVKISGLLPSVTGALNKGDLLEFRPNGTADKTPRLHSVMVGGSTDSDGCIGVEIRPVLRTALAKGDMVALDWPSSVFHLVDDDQGEVEVSRPYTGSYGFSLIEAIENV